MHTLCLIVLLAKFLIPQELGVHALCGHVLGALLLLDTIGVSLMGVVMRACVL